MEDYKPNSNRSKAENATPERKIEKVTTGPVTVKKKSGFDKFKHEIISEDAKNVKSYVVGDVLIPALKKAISDIITNGIDIILYGESRGNKRRDTYDRVSYGSYYASNVKYSERPAIRPSNYSFDDVVLSTRGEAEEVLMRMDELMETYGLVRVADLYDLVGITADYTANKYGWMNIRSAEVVRVRDGYVIKMPRVQPLD